MNPRLLPARNPGLMTGSGNATYLIGARSPVLIDAGIGQPDHVAVIADAVARGDGSLRVAVTHVHPDHASGAPAIAARIPAARFAKFPWAEEDARYAVGWEPLADGDTIDTDEGRLLAVHTPGHAPDHLCFWDEAGRTLFSGDLAVIGSTVVIPASARGDLAAYLASLRRVLALAPARMLPAHGPAIDDPAALLNEYLAHRLERERQVLELLDTGIGDLDTIVARIYVGIDPRLVPLARESITAHLLKLQKEGRAEVDRRNHWRIAEGRL